MSSVLSISAAIARLGAMAAAARGGEVAAMARACRIVQREARGAFGHDAAAGGAFPAWPRLAADTEAQRTREGYPPDAALLRSGALRDSIAVAVAATGDGRVEGAVGSASAIAVYQELGTSQIPPRSFLAAAAIAATDEVVAELGRGVVTALAGGGGGGLPGVDLGRENV